MRKIYRFIKTCVKPLNLGRFAFFGKLNKKITEKIRTNHALVDGHKMTLDDKDSLRLSLNGIYEPEQTNYIKNLLQEEDQVIDIGGNIGYYALIMAKKVGAKGKVFCFEPDKTNFSILTENICQNKYENIITSYNDAVSNEKGVLKLFISETNRGDHRIYSSDQDRNFIEINAVKLDDLIELKEAKIKFIKIDIQGSEMIALEGMKELILKNKPVLISEFWPKGIKMSGKNPDEYIQFFLSNGYAMSLLTEKGLKPISKDELNKEVSIEKGNFTNIVFRMA
jgi:FkbM family methyltransferase